MSAVEASSIDSSLETVDGISSCTPGTSSNPVEALPPRTREIFHIAFLLHQLLPADLVPKILDYAQLWQTVSLGNTDCQLALFDDVTDPVLQARPVVPSYIPPGAIRALRFRFHKYTRHSYFRRVVVYLNDDELDRYSLWFEVGVIDVKNARALSTGKHGLDVASAHPEMYKYGGKRIATMDSDMDFLALDCRWAADHEDGDVRRILQSLRGGCMIELCAFKTGKGETDASFAIETEIEYAVVRKM